MVERFWIRSIEKLSDLWGTFRWLQKWKLYRSPFVFNPTQAGLSYVFLWALYTMLRIKALRLWQL